MLLVLGDVPGVEIDDLMARVSKVTGTPGVRGPIVDVRTHTAGDPLAALCTGDKLHILAPSNGTDLAGVGPAALMDMLVRLGWSKSSHLKQIHLIAPSTGGEGAASFAARFEAEIQARGFHVEEVKAPTGPIRCDDQGKIWVYQEGTQAWTASSPVLNAYVGPHVAEKHR